MRVAFRVVPMAASALSELSSPLKATPRFVTASLDEDADSEIVFKESLYFGMSFRAVSATSLGTFPTFRSLLISVKSLAFSSSNFRAWYGLPEVVLIPLKDFTRSPYIPISLSASMI